MTSTHTIRAQLDQARTALEDAQRDMRRVARSRDRSAEANQAYQEALVNVARAQASVDMLTVQFKEKAMRRK